MATQQTFDACMAMLSSAYPSQAVAPGTSTERLYFRLLVDIPDEILEAATIDHISKSQWFPKVSELRQAALTLAAPQYPPALEAWGEVNYMIRMYGRSWDWHFDNPITTKTVQAMGWYSLCVSEFQTSDRARFIELYDQYVTRADQDVHTLPEIKALAERLQPKCLAAPVQFETGTHYQDVGTHDETAADIGDILRQERSAAFDRGEGEG